MWVSPHAFRIPRHQMFLQEAGLETERGPGRAGDHALRHATFPGATREDGDGWKINDGLYTGELT